MNEPKVFDAVAAMERVADDKELLLGENHRYLS